MAAVVASCSWCPFTSLVAEKSQNPVPLASQVECPPEASHHVQRTARSLSDQACIVSTLGLRQWSRPIKYMDLEMDPPESRAAVTKEVRAVGAYLNHPEP